MEVFEQSFIIQRDVNKIIEDLVIKQGASKTKAFNELYFYISTLDDVDSTVCRKVSGALSKVYKDQGYIKSGFESGSAYDKAIIDYHKTLVNQLPKQAFNSFESLQNMVMQLAYKNDISAEQALKLLKSRIDFKGFTLVDKLGRKQQFGNMVKMYVRNTMKDSVRNTSDELANVLGTDVFQISKHAGARELCEPWQEKYISETQEIYVDYQGNVHRCYKLSETSFGNPAGLFGINCRHIKYPMVVGFKPPLRFDPLLQMSNAINRKQISIQMVA